MWQNAAAPPLDPGFQPAIRFHRQHLERLRASGAATPLVIALEREHGLVSRYATLASPAADPATLQYAERLAKFLRWARGGWRLTIAGPPAIGDHIRQAYRPGGPRAFDADLMSRVYGRPFEVCLTEADSAPAGHETSAKIGGHFDGCRLGFDLGASDYKIAAVKDGEPVFSAEFPWN